MTNRECYGYKVVADPHASSGLNYCGNYYACSSVESVLYKTPNVAQGSKLLGDDMTDEQCQNACYADPGCQYYASEIGGKRECWGSPETVVPKTGQRGWKSGKVSCDIDDCTEADVDYRGHDIVKIPGVPGLTTCMAECANHRDCEMVTHDSFHQNCLLKSGEGLKERREWIDQFVTSGNVACYFEPLFKTKGK